MKIQSFSDGCGAMVSGVQLADAIDEQIRAIRDAFVAYGVIFFREQSLSPEQHLVFARRMGDIVVNKFFMPLADFPEIAEVRKEKDQQMNIGGGWHTDHSYDVEPALGSILVARALPESGGDTWFANLANAFDALPDALKNRLRGLRAKHSNRHIYGEGGYYAQTDLADRLGGRDRVGDAVHPVVIVHPESGREVLYVNPAHTIQLEGMDEAESKALLEQLYEHVVQEQFICRFNWESGSVALWDNRSTWHFAQNDYPGQDRLMHRITLAGSALSAAA
jgi:taurine dioxygenase